THEENAHARASPSVARCPAGAALTWPAQKRSISAQTPPKLGETRPSRARSRAFAWARSPASGPPVDRCALKRNAPLGRQSWGGATKPEEPEEPDEPDEPEEEPHDPQEPEKPETKKAAGLLPPHRLCQKACQKAKESFSYLPLGVADCEAE